MLRFLQLFGLEVNIVSLWRRKGGAGPILNLPLKPLSDQECAANLQ